MEDNLKLFRQNEFQTKEDILFLCVPCIKNTCAMTQYRTR